MYDKDTLKGRWRRWLGQKARYDRDSWTRLLESDYMGWARGVLNRHGVERINPCCTLTPHVQTQFYFRQAIDLATPSELKKLDMIYCEEQCEE